MIGFYSTIFNKRQHLIQLIQHRYQNPMYDKSFRLETDNFPVHRVVSINGLFSIHVTWYRHNYLESIRLIFCYQMSLILQPILPYIDKLNPWKKFQRIIKKPQRVCLQLFSSIKYLGSINVYVQLFICTFQSIGLNLCI